MNVGGKHNMKIVTAGREILGKDAPLFATLNDDVLFGQVWSREEQLSLHDRSMITVVSLLSNGILDSSLEDHLQRAKENGISKEEMVEIITHISFYAGWPKAWAAFRLVQKIYQDETKDQDKEPRSDDQNQVLFERGEKNDAFASYFTGQSYLKMLSKGDISIANVTFEPKCRNHWHIHKTHMQVLIVTQGCGWYQEWGKPASKITVGDIIEIPAGTKHWHGANKFTWFSHLAIEVNKEGNQTLWFDAMEDDAYQILKD